MTIKLQYSHEELLKIMGGLTSLLLTGISLPLLIGLTPTQTERNLKEFLNLQGTTLMDYAPYVQELLQELQAQFDKAK